MLLLSMLNDVNFNSLILHMPKKVPTPIDFWSMTFSTGTCVSDTVTINSSSVLITTESLSTVAGAEETITLYDDRALTTSMFLYSVGNWTNSQWTPGIGWATCTTNGTVTITVTNLHAGWAWTAFNGTLKIPLLIVNGSDI